MAITLTEMWEGAEATGDSLRIPYRVDGTDDPSVAVRHGPTRGLYALVNGRLWRVKDKRAERLVPNKSCRMDVDYEVPQLSSDPDSESQIEEELDISTETVHIVTSYAQTAIGSSVDKKGLIGATGDKVEGVDILMPSVASSLSFEMTSGQMTNDYIQTLAALVGKMNDDFFWRYNAGECLFAGARMRRSWDREDGAYRYYLSYSFKARPNETVDWIDGFDSFSKKGWQYMWIDYAEKPDDDDEKLQPEIRGVYLEDVYQEGNFSLLGIGIPEDS